MEIITKNIPETFVILGELEIQIDEFEQIFADINNGVYIDDDTEITKELEKLKIIEYDKYCYTWNSNINFKRYYDKFNNLLGNIF